MKSKIQSMSNNIGRTKSKRFVFYFCSLQRQRVLESSDEQDLNPKTQFWTWGPPMATDLRLYFVEGGKLYDMTCFAF